MHVAADSPAVQLDVGDVGDVVAVAERRKDPDRQGRPRSQPHLEVQDGELHVVGGGHVPDEVLQTKRPSCKQCLTLTLRKEDVYYCGMVSKP